MAEYEALLSGLRIAIELGIKCLDVRGDSQLVIDQVMKESSCHDPKMEAYCNAVCRLEDKFDGLELNHVPRKYNEDVDELAKIASGRTTVPPNIFAHDISRPSVEFKQPTESGPSSAGPSGGNPPAGTPRRTGSGPWILTSGQPPRMRPKRWKWTRPPLRETGVFSTSTGWFEGSYPLTALRRDALPGGPSPSF